MSGAARISYVPRSDATPEAELNTLASIYRFILDSNEKEAAPESRPDAGKEINEQSGKPRIPQQG